jgi:hypothetical protein
MPEPHISTIIKDYATAVALLAGGAWAYWRWRYEQAVRQGREMASPDGTLSVSSVDLDSEHVIATLNALWRNRGPLLIELCAEHSSVRVFVVEGSPPVGPLTLDEPFLEIPPWWSMYVLEPNTESIMQEHLTLERGRVYAFRWRLCLAPGSLPGKLAGDHMQIRRELLWRAPNAES